jgi:hypothetical protein
MLEEAHRAAEIAQFKHDYGVFMQLSKVRQTWAEEMTRRSVFQRFADLKSGAHPNEVHFIQKKRWATL